MEKSLDKERDIGETPYEKRWWALAAICIPLIIVSIDGTILNVALPTISKALQTTSSQLIWINSAYIIIFGSTILFAGALGDKYGRKWMLEAGILIFGIGSAWAGFSGGTLSLILARSFMGVGGGLIMPATLSLITNIFSEDERPKAIGIWAGMSGIGVAVGPLAGGLLLTWFTWGSVFFVNIPIVIIGITTIYILVPNSKASDSPPIDWKGAVLSFAGLLSLFYGLIQGPDNGWASGKVVIAFVMAAAFLVSFVLLELHMKNPLLEIRFFKIPEFSSGVISIAIGFFALYGLLYVLTIYIQSVLSYTPLQAGLALVPFAMVLLVGSPLVPRLVNRISQRIVVSAGLVIAGCGMLVFTAAGTSTGYPLILLGLILVSGGLIMLMVPSSDAIMGSIPKDQAGEGSAMNAAIRQVGSSLGIAVIGGLASLGYATALAKSATYQALPASSAATAQAGLAGALRISKDLGASGTALAEAAKASFVKGLDAGMIITAVVAFVGAGLAFYLIPRKK